MHECIIRAFAAYLPLIDSTEIANIYIPVIDIAGVSLARREFSIIFVGEFENF